MSEETGPRGAEASTSARRAAESQELPFANRDDFALAQRGFLGTIPDATILAENGHPVWSVQGYAFLSETETAAPDTVHPSLWRQAQLNTIHGLFAVTDRIYQIRGFDLSNMTIIEGDTGLIVVDPLLSVETARAGMDLYFARRPRRPIHAVLFTHSHADHYAGVKGIVTEEDVRTGAVQILAPEGFLEHAVSENVFAGNAMSRRATYMYGALLPKGPLGQVDAGLGKTTAIGTVSLIPPTDIITTTGESRTIDGVELVFQMAHGTEAPAEFIFYLPQFRALCSSEVACHTLHNVYTLRGAEVRDARAWWKALHETLELFGEKTDVLFASHHWPIWGGDEAVTFLKQQRDTYKYIHDQSLRLLNKGATMNEIAEELRLPASLAGLWHNRDYYGSLRHNAKAIYQKYLGWYDSNPAHLDPLPPVEAAVKYVEFMGGADAVVERARASYAQGEYRWVAEVLHHVIFAEPEHRVARELAADALEQLGYQTENSTWRNEYLMGAYELRHGTPQGLAPRADSPDSVRAMTLDMLFDYLGIRLNGPKAEGKRIALNIRFSDLDAEYALTLENAVLVYSAKKPLPDADVTLTLTRAAFEAVILGASSMADAMRSGSTKLEGDAGKLTELLALLDIFEFMFNIVTP